MEHASLFCAIPSPRRRHLSPARLSAPRLCGARAGWGGGGLRWGGGRGLLGRRRGAHRHPTLSQTNKLRGRATPPPTLCPHPSPKVCIGGGWGAGDREIWDAAPRQGGCRNRGPSLNTPLYTPQSRSQPGRMKLLRIFSPSPELGPGHGEDLEGGMRESGCA